MKRIFIILFAVLACVFNANAQLVVDSLGKVGIGTETPQSELQIGSGGSSDATVSIRGNKQYGLYVLNRSMDKLDYISTIQATCVSNCQKGIGIAGRATGYGCDSISCHVGVHGCASGGSGNAVGVLGSVGGDYSRNYAGIYGTLMKTSSPTFSYPGRYAGYFVGNVLVKGRIYGSVYSLSSVPTPLQAHSITDTANGEEAISDKLLSVRTIQFMQEEMVDQTVSDAASAVAKKDLKNADLVNFDDDTEENIKTEMVKHYGLDGAQLKAVFPELVDEDSQGNYRINYSEMVPLLLQSIRELSARVEELEGEKSSLAKKAKATSIESESESTDIVRMSQNKPNPFSESSVITLSIPEGTKSAAIYVYDLSGKQVKNIPVDKRGETDITVYASDLSEGMFVYSLVTDGTVAATRRMMVVKN